MEARLARGNRFMYQGRELTIVARLPDGALKVQDIVTEQFEAMPEEQIIGALYGGHIDFITAKPNPTKNAKKVLLDISCDLSLASPKDKAEVKRRYSYVRAVLSKEDFKKSHSFINPIIIKVAKKIKDKEPPSASSVYRWLDRYLTGGRSIRALLPVIHRRGNRSNQMGRDPDTKGKHNIIDKAKAAQILTIIEEVFNEKYLSTQRRTVADVYDTVVDRIGEYNAKQRNTQQHLAIPSCASLYNYSSRLDPFEVSKARYGEVVALQKWGCHKQGLRPKRPLEIVAMDHTKLDLIALDSQMRMPLGRPWLTVAIDLYTRMVVGLFISYNPPSAAAVLHCLKNLIEPKTYIKTKYPHLKGNWNCYGIPGTILVDNGKEFWSDDVGDACHQLGINIDFNRPKKPWHKSGVERWIRTHNEGLVHLVPGTTFSNYLDKGEYNPVEQAAVDVIAFEELIHTYIVDYYHYRPHRGIRDIPSRLWDEAIQTCPPVLPRSWKDLNILLGCITDRVIRPSGIQIDNLLYNSEPLCLLHRRLGKESRVKVKIDPFDLSHVFVADEQNREYFEVPALDQEYTKSLTQWQHHIITRFVNKRLKEAVDPYSLADAKRRIQRIIDSQYQITQQVRGRQKIARYTGQMMGADKQLRATDEPRQLMPAPAIEIEQAVITGSTWDGVSDMGQEIGQSENQPHPQIEEVSISTEKPKSSKKKPRKRKNVIVPEAENESTFVPPVSAPQAELDLSGWDVTYLA